MFTVIWQKPALADLADIYVQSDLSTQRVIAGVCQTFTAQLAADPAAIGESRGDWQRVAFHQPYAISYRTDPVDHVVRVGRFWKYE